MRRRPAIVAIALFSCTGTSLKSNQPTTPGPALDDELVVLRRESATAAAPRYSLVVRADGHVDFDGRNDFAKGHHEKQLSPLELEAMREACATSGVTNVVERRQALWVFPGVSLVVRELGTHKTIEWSERDEGAPLALFVLADRLDAIVGTSPWIDHSFEAERTAVHFAPGEAVVRDISKPIVQALQQRLFLWPRISLEIDGHADANEPENLGLERALVVRNALSISDQRLKVVGYGASVPISSNTSDEGRALNRRVDFKRIDAPTK